MKNYLLGLLMLPLIFNIIVPDAQAGSLADRMNGFGVYRGGSGSGSPVTETQPDKISEEGTDDQYAEGESSELIQLEVREKSNEGAKQIQEAINTPYGGHTEAIVPTQRK